MKKFLIAATTIVLMTACGSGESAEQTTNDSTPAATETKPEIEPYAKHGVDPLYRELNEQDGLNGPDKSKAKKDKKDKKK